jgi:hypothetical protein
MQRQLPHPCDLDERDPLVLRRPGGVLRPRGPCKGPPVSLFAAHLRLARVGPSDRPAEGPCPDLVDPPVVLGPRNWL